MNIYITGDTHLDFHKFPMKILTDKNATVIILGDHLITHHVLWDEKKGKYHYNSSGDNLLSLLSKMPCNFFLVQGGNDAPPQFIEDLIESYAFNGKVYIHPDHPSIMFAIDGEMYDIDNKKCLVLGGASSPSLSVRTNAHENPTQLRYFPESEDILDLEFDDKWLAADTILAHTCPLAARPYELYKDKIIKTESTLTEEKLTEIVPKLPKLTDFYCGYFHADLSKKHDGIKYHFLYKTCEKL